MKVAVHRAVFGEVDRKHSLRTSSLHGDQRLDGLAARTDRPSADPPQGSALSAYLSGFPYEQWYVLVRTFPDEAARRSGMVRSFCVLLEQAALPQIGNLMGLIQLLPPLNASPLEWNVWEEAAKARIQLQVGTGGESSTSAVPELLGLATCLVQGVRPAVWTGQQVEFERALARIWMDMPSGLRPSLRFGHSHAPVDLPSSCPHTVSSPALAAPRWHGRVITPVQMPDASPAARLLVGDESSTQLAAFVAVLPAITDFVKLDRAQTCLMWLHDLEGMQETDALPVARLLKNLAPAPQDVADRKATVLEALVKQLAAGDVSGVQRFANFDAQAFAGSASLLQFALENQVAQLLAQPNAPVDVLITRSFDADVVEWWRDGVLGALSRYVQDLNVASAPVVWRWWAGHPSIISAFAGWWMPRADEVLFRGAPPTVARDLAQALLDAVPPTFMWLRVIAWAVLYKPEEALPLILQEPFAEHEGVRALRARIGDQTFLSAALESTDARAWREAGMAVRESPGLLSTLDPRVASWRAVWHEAVRLGVPPLDFVPDPEQIVTSTLEALRSGDPVPEGILTALSETSQANLLHSPLRKQTWAVLPASVKDAFLAATARALLASGEVPHGLEAPLADAALNPQQLHVVLRDYGARRAHALHAYVYLLIHRGNQEAQARAAVQALHTYRLTLSGADVEALAAFICRRSLQGAAQAAFTAFEAVSTPTLRALVEGTLELLPLLRRLSAHFALRRPDAEREYYVALRAALSRLFQRGPTYGGVWEDAGGDPSDLPMNTTPNEAWREAVQLIERGKVALPQLLKVARRQYRDDPELAELERLVHQIQK